MAISAFSEKKKDLKLSFSQKMAPTIFIKFCGYIIHPNLTNMTLSKKSLKLKKIVFIFVTVA